MIDRLDPFYRPSFDDLCDYVRNPTFETFCTELRETYQCKETIEYSSCSWEKGWNIKFKKAGKNLCTLYPRESYFTVLVVIGSKEKERVEALLPECTHELQKLYRQTKEGNGQRWLMVDLEDPGRLYQEVLSLIQIRRG